jgi:P pilus assembly chaperone PapD
MLCLAVAILVPSIPAAKAETISIVPPRFELFGNPGDVISEKIRVKNDGDSETTYQTEVEDFTAGDDQGGVNLIDDPNAPVTTFSLRKWITVEPSRFTVPAGQEKVVNYTIRIPKDGEPGGHYASIQIKLAGGQTAGAGASVESRLNSLVLLRVSGNITEKLTLEKFAADQSYYKAAPVNFELRAKNEGNVHLAPSGQIVITNIFKKKVAEIPLKTGNVLPESSRVLSTVWSDSVPPGRYTATLVSDYGQPKQVITASTTFIVFPPSLAILLGAVLVIILLLITQRKKFKKILHKLTSD